MEYGKYTDRELRQFELDKLAFERSISQRNYEIDNFWKRSWFFGGLLLAIGGAYFTMPSSSMYRIYVAFLGLLISFFQGLINRGSKYWQERWENKTKHYEAILDLNLTKSNRYGEMERFYLDACTLAKGENFLTRASRYSVSKLTFLILDLLTIGWLLLWFSNWHFHLDWNIRKAIDWTTVFCHLPFIVYILIFWFKGKVHESLMWEKAKRKQRVLDFYFKESEKYVENSDLTEGLESLPEIRRRPFYYVLISIRNKLISPINYISNLVNRLKAQQKNN